MKITLNLLALSIAAAILLIPFTMYNEVMLAVALESVLLLLLLVVTYKMEG